MLEGETQEIVLIGFDFTYWKRCNFLTLTSRYGKFNQETCTKRYHIRLCFVKQYDKNILACLSVHSMF